MDQNTAIQVNNLYKTYRLYDKPKDRLKEALGLGGKKKRYKEHDALKGIDLTIKKGETVGIIGTNGSGKSTILKIITGVLNPTEGEVDVKGRMTLPTTLPREDMSKKGETGRERTMRKNFL